MNSISSSSSHLGIRLDIILRRISTGVEIDLGLNLILSRSSIGVGTTDIDIDLGMGRGTRNNVLNVENTSSRILFENQRRPQRLSQLAHQWHL